MRHGTKQVGKRAKAIPVEKSSGNVFRDLGFKNATERLAKSEIAYCITCLIDERGLTQVKAAEILGIHQSDVSDLARGDLDSFSTDRLFRLLRALGQDIEIRIPWRPHRNRAGSIRVVREPRKSGQPVSRRRA